MRYLVNLLHERSSAMHKQTQTCGVNIPVPASRIRYLFVDIIKKCKRFSIDCPPKSEDVATVRASVLRAEEWFLEFSKDPHNAHGRWNEVWRKMNSLYLEAIEFSEILHHMRRESHVKAASLGKGGALPRHLDDPIHSFKSERMHGCNDMHSFKQSGKSRSEKFKLKEHFSNSDYASEEIGLAKPNAIADNPHLPNVVWVDQNRKLYRQRRPKNFNYTAYLEAPKWNIAAKEELAELLETLLTFQGPIKSREQVLVFLSQIGEVVDALDRKDMRVRVTYFPYYLAFCLVPPLLQCEFLKLRNERRTPDLGELRRYLTCYVASIIPDEKELFFKAKSKQNSPCTNACRCSETDASKVWGNVAMGHVAEMIEELLELPFPNFDRNELKYFISKTGNVSERLEEYDIKMPKTFFTFYLAFRLLPTSLRSRFVNSRNTTSIPNFGDLRMFLESYANPTIPTSHSFKGSPNERRGFTTPRPPIFKDVSTSTESSVVKHTEPSRNPVVIGSHSNLGDLRMFLEYNMNPTIPTSHSFKGSLNERRGFTTPRPPIFKDVSTSTESSIVKRTEPSRNPVVIGSYARRREDETWPSWKHGKHPVSLLNEFCTRRKYKPPEFHTVKEDGPPHQKRFIIKVSVNGVDYQPSITSSTKKIAKSEAAKVCLRSIGVLPNS